MSDFDSQAKTGACPEEAADFLRSRFTADRPAPRTAVILGSGLHNIATDARRNGADVIPYAEIPGMPVTRVAGHLGQLVTGGRRFSDVILLQGRCHLYEGRTFDEVTFSVRVLARLGVRTLIVTNAAGGIRTGMRPGDLMTITEHLNFLQRTSWTGGFAPVAASRRGHVVWSPELLKIANRVPTPLTLHQGCYAMMPGPNYETPAEVRMLRNLGAAAVGMSTVPEALVASEHGLEVLGVSCITNAAAGLSKSPLNHQEVGEAAARIETEFADWLQRVIAAVRDSEGVRSSAQSENSDEIGFRPVDV